MTKEIFTNLGFHGLRQTPIILELAGRYCVKLEGVLEDIFITVESWRYLTDFLILQRNSNLREHPLIMGRPCLETIDTFIGYRSGCMTILNG